MITQTLAAYKPLSVKEGQKNEERLRYSFLWKNVCQMKCSYCQERQTLSQSSDQLLGITQQNVTEET
jgi:hypothetical protein